MKKLILKSNWIPRSSRGMTKSRGITCKRGITNILASVLFFSSCANPNKNNDKDVLSNSIDWSVRSHNHLSIAAVTGCDTGHANGVAHGVFFIASNNDALVAQCSMYHYNFTSSKTTLELNGIYNFIIEPGLYYETGISFVHGFPKEGLLILLACMAGDKVFRDSKLVVCPEIP